MGYTYKYPRPAVTVDCLIYRLIPETQILLIERKHPPFENCWALPGGFIEMDEDLVESALRELKEETSLEGLELTQLGTYGRPGRDPRGRVISIVFWGKYEGLKEAIAGDDAKTANWFPIHKMPELAFDHTDIIQFASKKIPDLKFS